MRKFFPLQHDFCWDRPKCLGRTWQPWASEVTLPFNTSFSPSPLLSACIASGKPGTPRGWINIVFSLPPPPSLATCTLSFAWDFEKSGPHAYCICRLDSCSKNILSPSSGRGLIFHRIQKPVLVPFMRDMCFYDFLSGWKLAKLDILHAEKYCTVDLPSNFWDPD